MKMSVGAQNLWAEIQNGYVAGGYQPIRAWFIPVPTDGSTMNELSALGLVESRTVGGTKVGLTDYGIDQIVNNRQISDEAAALRREITTRYVAANYPPIQSWIVPAAPSVNELVARGFLQHFAIGGHALLTSIGQDWIMVNRE